MKTNPLATILGRPSRIVNKKAKLERTFPQEPTTAFHSLKRGQTIWFQTPNSVYSGLDTWYRLSFRSSVERSIPRICAARDLFQSV